MEKTGMLTVSEAVSRLDGTRLAIASAEDPFGAAPDFWPAVDWVIVTSSRSRVLKAI
jgi:hypothetical protein